MKIYDDDYEATKAMLAKERYLPFMCPFQPHKKNRKIMCGNWCPAFRYNERLGKVWLKCFPQENIFEIE